jgi:transposase
MLQELRVGEQRYRAVWEVLEGASVTEVARRFGVSRQSVHTWLRRYAADQGGLPRVFRTVGFVLFHAAACSFKYSMRTWWGVR